MKNNNKEKLFNISINPNSFRIESGHNIIGIIYVVLDNKSFPTNEWDDFAVAILNGWIEELIALMDDRKNVGEFLFMEDNYMYELEKLNNIHCKITLYFEIVEKKSMDSAKIIFSSVVKEILNAGRSIINICEKNNWNNDDLILLKSLYTQLKNKAIKYLA